MQQTTAQNDWSAHSDSGHAEHAFAANWRLQLLNNIHSNLSHLNSSQTPTPGPPLTSCFSCLAPRPQLPAHDPSTYHPLPPPRPPTHQLLQLPCALPQLPAHDPSTCHRLPPPCPPTHQLLQLPCALPQLPLQRPAACGQLCRAGALMEHRQVRLWLEPLLSGQQLVRMQGGQGGRRRGWGGGQPAHWNSCMGSMWQGVTCRS
jgi:hypothetical protein